MPGAATRGPIPITAAALIEKNKHDTFVYQALHLVQQPL